MLLNFFGCFKFILFLNFKLFYLLCLLNFNLSSGSIHLTIIYLFFGIPVQLHHFIIKDFCFDLINSKFYL